MKKIYVITPDGLDNWNRRHGKEDNFCDLTDEEFIEVSEDGGWALDSVEDLVAEMNADGDLAPCPDYHYLRVIEENEKKEDYSAQIPAWVSKEDIESLGYDASGVDNDMLDEIADRISDDLHEQVYNESLIQACQHEGLPLKEDVENARKKWEEVSDKAEWVPMSQPDGKETHCISFTTALGDYVFEGTGYISENGEKHITYLECELPNEHSITLIDEKK